MTLRLTKKGEGLVAELAYGHNPLAYLCSERPDDQKPVPHELCVICADGVEAITWKWNAMALVVELRNLAAELDAEAQALSDDPAAARAKVDAAARIRQVIA